MYIIFIVKGIRKLQNAWHQVRLELPLLTAW